MTASEPVNQSTAVHTRALSDPPPARAPLLRVYLLGRFRLGLGDTTADEPAWRLRKAKSLVKLLALAPDQMLHRDELLDALWPDLGPAAAGNNLRQTLSVARQVVQALSPIPVRVLQVQGERVVLYPGERVWIDADAFVEAADRARESSDLMAYYAALASYAGDLLPEDRYEEWSTAHRERLRAIFLSLLVDVAQLHEVRQEYSHAIQVYERLVASEPGIELAHVGLMRLFALTGQRSRALRQYQQLRAILAEDLGVEPDLATIQLNSEIVSGQFPATGSIAITVAEPGRAHNLPAPVTRLIGRQQDIATVTALLRANRLVTLTGAGGCGKTRLALAVAGELVGAYGDGVRLVDLASLSDPDLLHVALGDALDVREEAERSLLDSIVATIGIRRMLLVIDNCEHLIDAVAATVATLLAGGDGLTILATSREALRIPGELTWRVPELAVPDVHSAMAPAELQSIASVALFLDRVRLRLPEFELSEYNAPAIADICRRLDGLPLAIELAAARIPALSVEQVAGHLTDALAILTSGSRTAIPRHRTLRAALDWSYRLLGRREQQALNRLAIFSGGWTLEAARSVVAGETIAEEEVLDLLTRLVDASLVQVDLSPEGQRYGLLETIRQVAWEKLLNGGDFPRIRERHIRWFLQLAERAETHHHGPEQSVWIERLDRDHDNLRAALAASDELGEHEIALRLAGALAHFWWIRGHYAEGRGWLSSLLARAGNTPTPRARAYAIAGAALLAYRQGDWQIAFDLANQGLDLTEQFDDRRLMAWLLIYKAICVGELGDGPASVPLLERSVRLFHEVGDGAGAARALNSLGERARIDGEIERATDHYQESLRLYQQSGDIIGISMLYHNLACVAQIGGDLQQAATLFGQSLAIDRDLGNSYGISTTLLGLAGVAAVSGRSERAARLFGAADALMASLGISPAMADVPNIRHHSALAHGALGETRFQEHWSAGHRLTLDAAIAEALDGIDDLHRDDEMVPPDVLTNRELEVAILVARGLTNHQIANALGIAQRTVDTHVSNLLRKLQLASRAAVRIWVGGHGLAA